MSDSNERPRGRCEHVPLFGSRDVRLPYMTTQYIKNMVGHSSVNHVYHTLKEAIVAEDWPLITLICHELLAYEAYESESDMVSFIIKPRSSVVYRGLCQLFFHGCNESMFHSLILDLVEFRPWIVPVLLNYLVLTMFDFLGIVRKPYYYSIYYEGDDVVSQKILEFIQILLDAPNMGQIGLSVLDPQSGTCGSFMEGKEGSINPSSSTTPYRITLNKKEMLRAILPLVAVETKIEGVTNLILGFVGKNPLSYDDEIRCLMSRYVLGYKLDLLIELVIEHVAVRNVALVLEEGLFASDEEVLTIDEQPLPYLVLSQMVLRQIKVDVEEAKKILLHCREQYILLYE